MTSLRGSPRRHAKLSARGARSKPGLSGSALTSRLSVKPETPRTKQRTPKLDAEPAQRAKDDRKTFARSANSA
jgi:hypothetical protein